MRTAWLTGFPAVCLLYVGAFLGLAGSSGCRSVAPVNDLASAPAPESAPPAPGTEEAVCSAPRELAKVAMPVYRIEPPDILTIDAIHAVPKPPYRLQGMDVIFIQAPGALPDVPIGGLYGIEPGGLVNLGPPYGSVKVAGCILEEAQIAIENHLQKLLRNPRVYVALAEMATRQQIAGEHLVGPDGTVTLGCYGSVFVAGMTLAEARAAIECHLADYLENPKVSVDVFAYNSKVYYVITEGAGLGDRLYRFPVTGNETVLDAISQINGLEQVSSKRIWIARPNPETGMCQVLPVRWGEITAQGVPQTNYQLFPGDRVFIAEDKLVALDTGLAKLISPVERLMGFTLLGTATATRLSGPVLRGGGNRNATF